MVPRTLESEPSLQRNWIVWPVVEGTTAELVAALQEKQKARPDQAVVIAGDKNVRYEEVLKVMDELQKQNVRKVGLLVRPAAR